MKKYTFPTCFFVIFTFFQHYLGHFLTLFQLYVIATNRPCGGGGGDTNGSYTKAQ